MSWIVKDASELVEFLRTKGGVYGPAGDDRIVFDELGNGAPPNLSRLSDVSARNVFQPMTHYYLRFEDRPDTEVSFRDYDTTPRVVVGLRPCDVAALTVHDTVFAESGSYRALRDATAIVGLVCPAREEACFCDSVGVDPRSTDGMDAALTVAVGGGYVLAALTDKGRTLMSGAPFPESGDATAADFREADHPVLAAEGVPEALGRLREMEIWDEIGFACVNCRVCTYVCPTCHCFTVTDEVFGTEGGRAAVWDSCQSKSFTKEASGHNPRATKPARVRQRILHKYAYYPEVEGALMCGGCGRCIKGCPTGRNIVEELTLLKGGAAT